MRCDFCGHDNPPPVWSFAQKKGFTVVTELDTHRFEAPWACCEICKPLVVKRQLHLILARAQRGMLDGEMLNRQERRFQRWFHKKVFQSLFNAGLKDPVPLEPGTD
ncbi:hypothetical protein [Nonomuraea jabiensis]|uniref:hypothetical protein n=1 Tax=Nonomuraea jabiensis TaxID=882448 RepID=UPI003D73C239